MKVCVCVKSERERNHYIGAIQSHESGPPQTVLVSMCVSVCEREKESVRVFVCLRV